MALNFNRAPRNNAQGNAEGGDQSWKASAFLNLWVKRPDGSRYKIGFIPLKDQRNVDKNLIDRLQKEGGLEAMLPHLEIDFQMADKPVGEFNLGF